MAKKTGVELEFSILDDGFNKSIKEMNTAISSMRKELNLNNEVLKGSSVSTTDYQNKLQKLREQEELSRKKVEETRTAYEKVKEMLGENATETQKYKNKLVDAEIEHQRITNSIETTTKSLEQHENTLKENEKRNRELNSSLGLLNTTINEQKEHLDDLKKQYVNAVLEQGKSSTQAKALKNEIKNLTSEITTNETKLGLAEKQLEKFTDAEDNAGRHAVTFGEMIKANLISDIIKKGISSLANGVKELGTTLFEAGKKGFNSFSEFEQLVGGVDTLFKNSSSQVQKYANDAYRTAGLSANAYLQTVTSFSASLIQGLNGDTAKAAKIADMAITDMSDNANKMGTDIAMIQNAYQGFAKQNYTMLDNLKLGYGGTKTEMERLLAHAEKLTGIKYDISNLSDVYNAIHVIQGELGITGTTAKESATTIQGSVASMKSAWQNLLTGMADENANHKQLVTNFVNSIIGENGEGGVLGNIIPRIKIMVKGAKDVLNELWKQLPKISEEIPELKPFIDSLLWIKDNGAIIVSTIAGITTGMVAFKIAGTVTSVVKGFKLFFTTIKAGKGIMAAFNLVMSANPIGLIVMAVVGLVTAFITLWNTSEGFRNFWIGLWDNVVNIVSGAIEGIKNFFSGIIDFVVNNWQGLLLLLVNPFVGGFKLLYDNCEGFRNFVNTFVQNVISFFQQIPTKIDEFVQNTISFFQALPEKLGYLLGLVIGHILKFGVDAFNWVTTEVPKIVNGIINFFKKLPGEIWNLFLDIINKTINWGIDMALKAKETASTFFNNVILFFKELPGNVWKFLTNVVSDVINWGINLAAKGKSAASSLFNSIVNIIKNLPNEMFSIGKNLVQGIWNGINNAKDWIIGKIKSFGKGITDGIKSVFGIHSPSTVMRDLIGKNLALGIGEGFANEMKNVTGEMQNAIPKTFDIDMNTNLITNDNNPIAKNDRANITDTSYYDPGQVVPIYLTIENFNNNREQDIEDLSEELEYYRMKVNYGKGNA